MLRYNDYFARILNLRKYLKRNIAKRQSGHTIASTFELFLYCFISIFQCEVLLFTVEAVRRWNSSIKENLLFLPKYILITSYAFTTSYLCCHGYNAFVYTTQQSSFFSLRNQRGRYTPIQPFVAALQARFEVKGSVKAGLKKVTLMVLILCCSAAIFPSSFMSFFPH